MRAPQDTMTAARSAPVRRRGKQPIARFAAGVGWLVVTAVVLAGLAAASTVLVEPPIALPDLVGDAGAVTLTTVLTGLAAHRTGSRTAVAVLFAAVVSIGAVTGGWLWLVSGTVAFTSFVGAVLAVVFTRPAEGPAAVIREYVVAVALALTSAVGAAAYQAPVRMDILVNLVSIIALITTLWLAYRLGGGFHGLGRRGGAVIITAVAVIVVGVAYSEALQRWGSPGMIEGLADIEDTVRSTLGALPPPLEILVGFPALVWGLATRSQLRQGWWICAFGTLATAGMATALASPTVDVQQALLGIGYAAVIGLVIGFVIWRLDQSLTGPKGRRARRGERTQLLRPEPRRTRPLM